MNPNSMNAGAVAPGESNNSALRNGEMPVTDAPSTVKMMGAEAVVVSEEIAESAKMPKDDVADGVAPGNAGLKKGGRGMLIGMILFALVAMGGIGFGIWAMMDGNNQKSQVEKQLNTQISSLKQQNAELIDKLAAQEEKPVVEEDVVVDTETEVNPEDYIYVGEWGIKIKIPTNLENVSYKFYSWDNEEAAGDTLCVAGSASGYGDAFPSFLSEYGSSDGLYVCVSKNSRSMPEDSDVFWTAKVPVGEYYVQGPQALNGSEADADWEVESAGIIHSMLSTDNFSTI